MIRAIQKLADIGTEFNQSVHLNYTRINLYSDTPVYLGNESVVKKNEDLYNNITNFYQKFQSHQPYKTLLTHLLEAYIEVFKDNTFYLFYNFEYYFLPMKEPYIKLTYYEVPFPKPGEKLYYKKHTG